MTAHVAKYKHVYCGIWTEVQSGRSGNDIASAIFKLLCEILKNHTDITDLITWSDSCVPQNRNQMMSLAMLNILNLFPHLSSVTMKFSTPGHSCIQEVDNVHSHIEKVMAVSEFWSPVSFLRLLLRVNRKTPYNVVQLKNQHFKDFHKSSKHLPFDKIPFSQVCQIQFKQNSFTVGYKLAHHSDSFTFINLRNLQSRISLTTCSIGCFNVHQAQKRKSILSKEKEKDILFMLKWMPEVDKAFYKAALKNV